MKRRWVEPSPVPADALKHFADIPAPIVQVLHNRNFNTREAIERFFAHSDALHNPFRMKGMTETVRRLRQAIRDGETVMVHGDFDADGVTSTVVMVTGLHALGANVAPYIPHRVDEGYGLNESAIGKMKDAGVTLMITVDCGIRATREIAFARDLGIDVLVTDHHSVPETLPPALAVVNPHQPECEYPYKHLAGVGLAWKTVQALWLAERKSPIGKTRDPNFDPENLLELVAIGTVADVAPLNGENRTLVRRGLAQLRHTNRPGLRALYQIAGLHAPQISEESIGFGIAPRINAAGRLKHAKIAYGLLYTADPGRARDLARDLEEMNRNRQRITKDAMERAFKQLPDAIPALVMVRDAECPQGIVGLVAGRLQEIYYRPSIVVAEGDELSHASCRSIPEFHITNLLSNVEPLLERYGGHAQAAGFTVRTEHLPELQRQLQHKAHESLILNGNKAALEPRLDLDAELPLREISDTLMLFLEQMAPFGEGNRQPVWFARNVTVTSTRTVGANGAHLQFRFRDDTGKEWKGVAFRQGKRISEIGATPQTLDLAFTLRKSEWQGESNTELHISDFRFPLA